MFSINSSNTKRKITELFAFNDFSGYPRVFTLYAEHKGSSGSISIGIYNRLTIVKTIH